MEFNWYHNLRFVDDDKAICMRVNSLIPSRDKLIYDFMERDPLEKRLLSLSL